MEIIAYITEDRERVLGGKPLVLHMRDDEVRQQYLASLADTFEADVVRMCNGDHMIVKR